jgi:hypothetical protein
MYNKKKFGFYFSIYLSLGHHKERPSYRRSLQPSAENIQPFKTEKNRMRIRIRIWIQIRKSVVRIWVSVSVPKCHRSTILALGILSRIRSLIRILMQICTYVSGTDPRIRIPDPYQNVTDLQHTGPRNAVLDPVAIIVITISPSPHRKKRVLIRHFLCPKGV